MRLLFTPKGNVIFDCSLLLKYETGVHSLHSLGYAKENRLVFLRIYFDIIEN